MAEQEQEAAAFALKTAMGLVADVDEETEDVVQLTRLAGDEDDFWRGMKISWKAAGQVGRLESDLRRAIEMAESVSATRPDVALDDGTTVQTVIGMAHYQAGLIALRTERWEEAVASFEESYSVWPIQQTLFNLAICRLMLKKRFKFSWWLLLLPLLLPYVIIALILMLVFKRSWLGKLFTSGRFSEDEIIDGFKRVIDADHQSDLAVEAGKMIARLRNP